MSYFMRSVFASLHMLIISQITVVGDMVDRCAGSRSWRYQGLLGDVVDRCAGSRSWRYQGLLGDGFDGTLDCWTIVCSIGWIVLYVVFSYTWAGMFYMRFSPTRGWIVLHEVFSYTWVGFLLVCVFYLIMCDRHMLLANQNYFRSDHFTNLCLFT